MLPAEPHAGHEIEARLGTALAATPDQLPPRVPAIERSEFFGHS